MKRLVWAAVTVIVLSNFYLLIGGNRLLIWEQIVRPGQQLFVEDWGTIAATQQQASLVCTYWTGRSVVRKVFWYGHMGRDACAFLIKEEAP